MVHSKKLEDTVLWKKYLEKLTPESKRGNWVKEVYETAAKYMLDVRLTFQNYTLHDETHILNVLDAMGGLLGDQVSRLTVGEMELLILAASLHDVGMVYTENEKKLHYDDAEECRKFLLKYCPEFLDCAAEDWTGDIRQWYLRTLHPFRIPEVLQNEAWKELFASSPLDAVPKRCIVAVCKAHGEDSEKLLHNRDLEYLEADDADPLFCALLLRLGDLLDFDDTRAPKVLYGYVACNDKSRTEWDKHRASVGFCYPESPSADDLPYKARCTSPGVEHAIRDFLDWIDDELGNCIRLQKYCRKGWQQNFLFPRVVSREEIDSDGYESGDFCLTMDQTQILKLLTGENLYDDMDVFVRELLQNAIDAMLLRGKMDKDFIPEQSRIDMWEWNDKEGNIWFRIDDQGTGMTLGMLKSYFLNVGNSYYISKEMERDLRDHGQTEKYNGISRFGIGFLSCFLCGDYAEVSTLYFDSGKNRREEAAVESYQTVHYGLRLQVTGLSGYYTLKNQAKHHATDESMPMPDTYDASQQCFYEREGYRAKAGTSIAIRLNPGKLGTLNLRDAVEKYLCGARVPVYYNNKRIGRTYEEVMRAAHEVAGERIYELTDKMKAQFNQSFPAVRGQYPKIAMTVVPLDTEEDHILSGVSGILVKYEVRFDRAPKWKVKDQEYLVHGHIEKKGNTLQVILNSLNTGIRKDYRNDWNFVESNFDEEAVASLEAEFERYAVCPREGQLGKVWFPFAKHMSLHNVWRAYNDYQQMVEACFLLAGCGCPDMDVMMSNCQSEQLMYVYQGVVAGRADSVYLSNSSCRGVFFLENEWIPETDVSRSNITGLPLIISVLVCGIINKYQMLDFLRRGIVLAGIRRDYLLKEWRNVQTPHLKQWMNVNQKNFFEERIQLLKEPLKLKDTERAGDYINYYSEYSILNRYHDAYLQDVYQMTINYEEGQTISFCEKEGDKVGSESALDLLPPMMFCKAASDRSRRYLCSGISSQRKGITLDHPFTVWFLDNADLLNQYYQRQFQQIVDCFYKGDAGEIIQECNEIRQQLISLPEHHCVDVSNFPRLSMEDFWFMEDSDI